MSKTYTFPQLNLVSGTFDITIKTSQGSGSTSVSEKYFSSINPLVKETEVFGGSLRQDSVSFSIEHDKDNYFRDTILASFQDAGGWVDILVQSNGVYEFYGTIDPTTVSAQRFYVDGDIHESISFDAHWILKRLERSKVEDLEALFSAVDSITTEPYSFRMQYLFDKIGELLQSVTGLTTVSFTFDLSTQYGAISKNCFIDRYTDSAPRFDDRLVGRIESTGSNEYVYFNDLLFIWKYNGSDTGFVDVKTNTLWDEGEADGNNAYREPSDQSFYNKDNVYEILIDVLKSWGFILTIRSITSTELFAVIKDRVDGDNVDGVLDQLTESSRQLLTTEYLEAITTTPKANNINIPEYEYLLKTNFGSSFSYTTAFKTEYIANNGDVVYKNQLYYRDADAVLVAVRDILEGNRLNTNADITDQLGGVPNGYTSATPTNGATLNCVDHTIDNHTPDTSNSGCVQIVSPVNVSSSVFSSAYLQVDCGEVDYETLVSFWVKFPSSTGISILTFIDFYIEMYDSSSTLIVPENSLNERYVRFGGGTFGTPTGNNIPAKTISVGNWEMVSMRIRPKRGDVGKYIRLNYKDTGSHTASADVTFRIDDISIRRSHQYFHQLLGRKLQRYYTRPNSKLKNRYSGIYDVNCGDNLSDNGIVYYVKKVAKDFQNNETEIEAINYQ